MITLDHGTPFEPQAPELRVLNVVGLGPEERQHAVWITERPGAGNLHVFLAEPKPDGRGILLHWIAIA